jgi:hypothetical protein
MIRLMELIGADHSTRVPYERRELALEYIVQVTDVNLNVLTLDTPVHLQYQLATCTYTCTTPNSQG